ncbi:Expansin-B15-like protein, partial [Drosera capensis]
QSSTQNTQSWLQYNIPPGFAGHASQFTTTKSDPNSIYYNSHNASTELSNSNTVEIPKYKTTDKHIESSRIENTHEQSTRKRGGACGYGGAVGQAPFWSMVAAGGPSLFRNGQLCGACYQLRCFNGACSRNPVTVTITDSCPGCPEAFHFDLSGKACGGMAKPGQDDQLRNRGVIQVQYRRVPCYYPNAKIAVQVHHGSTPYYFAGAIEFTNGDGTLKSVALQQSNQGSWIAMQEAGAIWKLNTGFQLKPPFSLRLTASMTGRTIVLQNVIPSGLQPGKVYWSSTNF